MQRISESVKEAVITGVPMLVFMATNFVKGPWLNTIIMNQIGEDGMAVLRSATMFADRGNAYRRNHWCNS